MEDNFNPEKEIGKFNLDGIIDNCLTQIEISINNDIEKFFPEHNEDQREAIYLYIIKKVKDLIL